MSLSIPISILQALHAERERQLQLFGDQRQLPDGLHAADAVRRKVSAQAACQRAVMEGGCTWAHILEEEVAEAFAAPNQGNLREELLQVAAVAIAWVDALDHRSIHTPLDEGAP